MAVEPFLPSEIARLVYGYLVEEKCTETAKSFLNESPNMYECRSVLQYGRTFTTRICGMALQEILEKFCAFSCIVQDELTILDGAHKLKNCKDIVTQTKFLLEGYRSQQATSSVNEPIEAGVNNPTSKAHKKRHSGKNENGPNIAMQSDDGYQTETPPDSNSLQNIPSVEATPLENLPGYVENLQTKKSEISRPVVLKTPTKFTNQLTQNLQMKENISSKVVKNPEELRISQATQFEKKVQSQEVQTSFEMTEMDEPLVPKPMMDKTQKRSIEIHEKSKENLKRPNAKDAVIFLQKSNCLVSKTVIPEIDLCNNLDSCSKNQEVINLDDSGDQTSLECPTGVDPEAKVSEACIEILEDVQSQLLSRTEIQEKIASNINKLMEPIKSMPTQGGAHDGNDLLMNDLDKIIDTAVDMTESDPLFIQLLNSIVRLDERVSSSEEVDMEIDNENPSSEETISNEDAIMEENKQCDPNIAGLDDILIMRDSPMPQEVQSTKTVETTKEVIKSKDTIIPDPEVCKKKYLAGQYIPISLTNIPNNGVNDNCSVKPIETSLFDKNFSELPDLPDNNTSTPLKLFAATQNYESNEWFTTQTLSPSINPMKETSDALVNGQFPYVSTVTESIVSPVDGFISPIVSKENTKVAEKIFLSCSNANAVKDDTLHTPDIPPVSRSFIPKVPAPIPETTALPKNKTSVLPKNPDGENVSPNVQKGQDTSSGFISISSLVKNTEFNRYFSIDSISVVHMDNTANAVQNRPTEPEIEVEDSVGFTGTGLSPFLKLNKKAEKGKNEQSPKIDTEIMNEAADNVIEEDMETNETNGKASEMSVENFVEGKFEENSREVASIPVTSQAAHEVNNVVNEFGKSVEVLTAAKIDDGTKINEDEELKIDTRETVQNIDVNLEKDVDSTSKAAKNEASTEIDGKSKKDMKEILNIVLDESFEKGEDALSKTHGKINSSTKNLLTLSQPDTSKHTEPKIQAGTGKKESLKSFLSKTFESFIDSSKDNTASNQNNEITKNTPKVLLDDRPKGQRRSLSTPKKPSSHIRALTFETPIQSRSDSKINDKVRCASPETAKRNLIRLHQSFQSPPVTDNKLVDQVQSTAEVSNFAKPANVIENFEDETMTDKTSNLSQEKSVKEGNSKRSWDSDLRLLVGGPSEQPKIEIPKRKSKTKSKEESSTKKRKRDKSKTPRKEKKSDKSPHKKSKKGEKEKTPKKSRKCDKLKEHRGNKKKIGDELSDKDCKDLGALIESNFLSSENDDTVDKFEIKEKVRDELSAKECKDISAQTESNLMLSKNNKPIKKVEIESKVEKTFSTRNLKDVNSQIENNSLPTENKNVKPNIRISKITSSINSKKDTLASVSEAKKVHVNGGINVLSDKSNGISRAAENQVSRQEVKSNLNSDNQKSNFNAAEENLTPKEPSNVKPVTKKDPLEYLLSDSINEKDVFNDIMEIGFADIMYQDELTRTKKQVDRETAEKMQQDEQAIAAVLEEANQAINEKFKSVDENKQQDFFPETSLMTDGDESGEEGEVQDNVAIPKTDGHENLTEQVNGLTNLQLEKENISLHESKEHTKAEDDANKTSKLSSKGEVDYEMIEKQLSILTDTEVSSARKVIYDQVSKVEGGRVVKKKYARLKTLEKRSLTDSKLTPMGGYEIVLDSSSSIREEDSMEMPPTPQITDPGSNSWLPNSVLSREDSRTILSSIPTPLECPPTPKILITPHKVEEEAVHKVIKKSEILPGYHLTPITFETTKKPLVTEFEVKETFKKITPKTPGEKEEKDSKSMKTTSSIVSSSRDKSVTDSDSEDSDSSSSSDSSDSSSSSSNDEDDCSIHPSELAETKELPLESSPKPETNPQLFFQNEEVVVGNEFIFIEHEEVIVATELSPAKVFPIQKTAKEIEETIKETPAKDENMIPEEGIFETPNISKPVENPTNLHAKISQMMILKEQEEMRRLESQQKPKIINVENVSRKIVMKNSTRQSEADIRTTASENKELKTSIVQKSEVEVAKAIESIASEKFDKNQDELNLSAESINSLQILNDKVKKRELSKAIQSITKEEKDEESSDSSSDDSSSDDEPNLKLVLEDDVNARRLEEVSEDESLGLDDNCDVKHAEHHFIFDQANYKKRRRKQFTDAEMSFQPQDEDGNILGNINPTSVDILLNLIPAKKKMEPKKKIKTEIKVEEEEAENIDDGDSSEDFVPVKNVRNTRGSTKRRRSNEVPKSRKRKKNIFIY